MSAFAQLHPQVVHFAIALLFLGVPLRLLSLVGRPKFADPAATSLLLLGTVAALVAIESGHDAHGPVERIPGARVAVIAHEEAAEKTHDAFAVVAGLELLALGLLLSTRTSGFAKFAKIGSAVVGIWGVSTLYTTAELGGELVYKYAGGPGLRSGEPADIERLLMAGLYTQAMEDRKAGRKADAARLIDEMSRRFSADTTVRFLRVESILKDVGEPATAMAALDSIEIKAEDARWQSRRANLKTDIFLAMQMPDSAKATLDAAIAAFPQNTRLKARRDSLP